MSQLFIFFRMDASLPTSHAGISAAATGVIMHQYDTHFCHK